MSNQQYYTLWKKYLPVIRVQMKNAKTQPQEIKMTKKEFEVFGKKAVSDLVFSMEIINEKTSAMAIGGSPVARDLFDILLGDKSIRELLRGKHYQIKLEKEFVLHIQLIETVEEQE